MKSESSLCSPKRRCALYLGNEPRTVELHDAKLGYVDRAVAELHRSGRAIVLRTKCFSVVRQLVALRLAANAAFFSADAPLLVKYQTRETKAPGFRVELSAPCSTARRRGGARSERDFVTVQRRRDAAAPETVTDKRTTHLVGVRAPGSDGLRALVRAGWPELEHIADNVRNADLRTTRKYLARARRREDNSALLVPLNVPTNAT